jgi:hypothetical protein
VEYEIIKKLAGFVVVYDCPRCACVLKSKLKDAGKMDECPECGARFIVPGEADTHRTKVAESEVREVAGAGVEMPAAAERQPSAKRSRPPRISKKVYAFAGLVAVQLIVSFIACAMWNDGTKDGIRAEVVILINVILGGVQWMFVRPVMKPSARKGRGTSVGLWAPVTLIYSS